MRSLMQHSCFLQLLTGMYLFLTSSLSTYCFHTVKVKNEIRQRIMNYLQKGYFFLRFVIDPIKIDL